MILGILVVCTFYNNLEEKGNIAPVCCWVIRVFSGFTRHLDSLGMAQETHPFNCLHLEILLTITIIVRQL